jgi:hypothetical protein
LSVTTLIDRTNAVSADLFGGLDETTSATALTVTSPVLATPAAVVWGVMVAAAAVQAGYVYGAVHGGTSPTPS